MVVGESSPTPKLGVGSPMGEKRKGEEKGGVESGGGLILPCSMVG
jgi:hypothetical protein